MGCYATDMTQTATLTATLSALTIDPATGGVSIGSRPSGSALRALLTFLYEYANGACTICREATDLDAGKGAADGACIGHIAPAGTKRYGYVAGNLMLLCNACNQAAGKRDLRDYFPMLAINSIPTSFPTGWREGNGKDMTGMRRNERKAFGFDF